MEQTQMPSGTPIPKRIQRDTGIDLLRIVACYFIIIIHISGTFYAAAYNTPAWRGALAQQALTRFAVPCFTMITGMLCLSHPVSIRKMWTKSIPRIVAPLLFWQLLYLGWSWRMDGETLPQLAAELQKMPFVHIRGHFWYGYMLVAFYAVLPLLKALFDAVSHKMQGYLILVTLGIPSAVDMLVSVLGWDVSSPLYVGYGKLGLSEIGLFCLGKWLADEAERRAIRPAAAAGTMLLGYGLTIACMDVVSHRAGMGDVYFCDYTRFPVLLFGGGVLVLFLSLSKRANQWPEKLRKGISAAGRLTMGVYFAHLLVAWAMMRLGLTATQVLFHGVTCTVGIYLDCLLYALVAFALCGVFSRLPGLRHMVL